MVVCYGINIYEDNLSFQSRLERLLESVSCSNFFIGRRIVSRVHALKTRFQSQLGVRPLVRSFLSAVP